MLLGAGAGALLGGATFLVLGVAAVASANRAGVAAPGPELLLLTVAVAAGLGAAAGLCVGLIVAIAVGGSAFRGAVPAVRLRATMVAVTTTVLALLVLTGWVLDIDSGDRAALTTILAVMTGPTAWLLTPRLIRPRQGNGGA